MQKTMKIGDQKKRSYFVILYICYNLLEKQWKFKKSIEMMQEGYFEMYNFCGFPYRLLCTITLQKSQGKVKFLKRDNLDFEIPN